MVGKLEPGIEKVNALLRQLSECGIRCVFLRELSAFNGQNKDLDFWCSLSQRDAAVSVLFDAGWHLLGGRELVSRSGKSQVYRFGNTRDVPVFELWVGDLRADALIYSPEKEFAPRTVQYEHMWVLSEQDLLNTLLLRPLLKKRGLSGYCARLSELNIPEEEVNKWVEFCRSKFGARVSDLLQKALQGATVRLPLSTLLRLLLRQHGAGGLLNLLWRQLIQKGGKVLSRPPIISVVGTDGSGKSTTCRTIMDFLSEQGVKAEIRYAGRSRNNTAVVAFVRRLVFQLGLAKEIPPGDWSRRYATGGQGHLQTPCRPVQALALTVYFMEYHARYVFMKFSSHFSKQVWVLDRGAWDVATLKGLGNVPVAVARYCPDADLTFFCHAPPRVIQSRKQERGKNEMIRHQAVFKWLTKHSDKPCMDLDTGTGNRDLKKISCQATALSLAICRGELDFATQQSLRKIPLTLWTHTPHPAV